MLWDRFWGRCEAKSCRSKLSASWEYSRSTLSWEQGRLEQFHLVLWGQSQGVDWQGKRPNYLLLSLQPKWPSRVKTRTIASYSVESKGKPQDNLLDPKGKDIKGPFRNRLKRWALRGCWTTAEYKFDGWKRSYWWILLRECEKLLI